LASIYKAYYQSLQICFNSYITHFRVIMGTSVLNGPIAPENNPPIEPQNFQPSVFPITAISYGINTTVTTGTAFGVSNNYVIGQLVRFHIPTMYGAQQLDGQSAYVIGIPGSNRVTVGINTSSGYNSFIPSPSYGPTPPQISAIGDTNSGPINASGRVNLGTTIQGSFINISPNEAI
jgi:hypothetical protein